MRSHYQNQKVTRDIAILAIRKVLELLDIGIISTKTCVSMKSSCNCLLWLKVKTIYSKRSVACVDQTGQAEMLALKVVAYLVLEFVWCS